MHLASQICKLVTCSFSWKYKQCHTCAVPWLVVHDATTSSTIAVALRPFQGKVGINVKCKVLLIPACKSVQNINNSCVITSDASRIPKARALQLGTQCTFVITCGLTKLSLQCRFQCHSKAPANDLGIRSHPVRLQHHHCTPELCQTIVPLDIQR